MADEEKTTELDALGLEELNDGKGDDENDDE